PKFFLTDRIDTLAIRKSLENACLQTTEQLQFTQTEWQYHTLGVNFLSKVTLIGQTKSSLNP
ncbi:MAG: hypothetical protein ACOVN3_08595, partial [Limnohabitans sp.]